MTTKKGVFKLSGAVKLGALGTAPVAEEGLFYYDAVAEEYRLAKGESFAKIADADDLGDIESALEDKIDVAEKGAANGVATLNASGKIPSAQVPAIAITEVFVVADIDARDALVIGEGDGEVQEGDVAIVLDDGDEKRKSFIYDGTGWQILNTADFVTSVNGQTGDVVLDSGDVAEGTNLYFTDARAKTAAVLNTLAGTETDQAPSVAAVNAALDALSIPADTDELPEGTTNLYFTEVRARQASVLNSLDPDTSELDFDALDTYAPSISAVNAGLDLKLEAVEGDTAPKLGGNLDLNGNKLLGEIKHYADGSATFGVHTKAGSAGIDPLDTHVAPLEFAVADFDACVLNYKWKLGTDEMQTATMHIAHLDGEVSYVLQSNEIGTVGFEIVPVLDTGSIKFSLEGTKNGFMVFEQKLFKA
jgi:hypothetical protein